MEQQLVAAFGAGAVVSAIVFFFVWKNNKKWFLDAESKLAEVVAAVKSGQLTEDVKAKLEALLAEIQSKK